MRLQPGSGTDYRQTGLPQETTCFRIETVRVEGAHQADFAFVQSYLDGYAHRCIGQRGLQLLVRRASDLILAHGYVTTRLLVPEQNLGKGTLRLTLLPGTVGAIRFAPGSSKARWKNALPLRPGGLLNLRAIEQGLEQLKRVPSQGVRIDIAPGAAPGTSDLVLTVVRARPWRLIANLDDSGSDATGKEQGGVTLALDQPLGINDLLTVGASHSVGRYHGLKGTHGTNLGYSVPWDDWTFSLSNWNYGYHQHVEGAQQAFTMTGRSHTTSLGVTRLLARDADSRTSVQLSLGAHRAGSAIEGVRIDNQERHTRTAELALLYRRYLGHAQLDLRLAHRRGVPWFGGQWEGGVDGGPTHRYGLTTLDASLSLPYAVGDQPWIWTSELHVQATGDTLYGEDYLAIGGRYTVRGFDGERTVSGPHGAYWRNTLTLPVAGTGVAVYGGLDVGHVDGVPTPDLSRKTLAGAVLGVRGGRWGLDWDLFAGWALYRPWQLETRRPVFGMQWVYTF